jgi:hypothetical protein
MANKLTNDVLNKLIMEAIEEVVSGGAFDPSAYARGAGAPFAKKGPKLGGAQGGLEQLLSMIQLSNEVPQDIKDYAAAVLITPKASTAKMGSQRVATPDLEELPSSAIKAEPDVTAKMGAEELPTPKFTPAQMAAASRPTSNLPAFKGPAKNRKPAPQMSKPGLFGRLKKAVGLEEQKKIEALVAEVLEEMAKKGKKEPKQEPKKTGKK